MSIKQMSAIWEHAHTNDPSTLLVMLALADWANDDGVCWPAVNTIANKCRISERQAQRIIKSLEDVGALEVERKSGRKNTNIYHLKVPDSHHLFGEKVTFMTEKVTFGAVKGDIAVSPEPSRTINKKQPSSTEAGKQEFILPSWVPRADWDDWLEVRKRKKVPPTPRSLALNLHRLEEFRDRGHPPEAILQLAIERGWTGLFEPSQNGNGKKSGLQESLDVIDKVEF